MAMPTSISVLGANAADYRLKPRISWFGNTTGGAASNPYPQPVLADQIGDPAVKVHDTDLYRIEFLEDGVYDINALVVVGPEGGADWIWMNSFAFAGDFQAEINLEKTNSVSVYPANGHGARFATCVWQGPVTVTAGQTMYLECRASDATGIVYKMWNMTWRVEKIG